MIKALIHNPNSGRRMLLLGLSAENVSRLMLDQPIKFDLRPLVGEAGWSCVDDIAIVGGSTEETITTQLADLLGEQWVDAVADGRVFTPGDNFDISHGGRS